MTFTVLQFYTRHPALTPYAFKNYYETNHIPLLQFLTRSHFPISHTRRYIQRSSSSNQPFSDNDHPAIIVVGKQSDFDYDVVAELVFENAAAFETFFMLISEEEAAEHIKEDEERFLIVGKTMAVVVGEVEVASREE